MCLSAACAISEPGGWWAQFCYRGQQTWQDCCLMSLSLTDVLSLSLQLSVSLNLAHQPYVGIHPIPGPPRLAPARHFPLAVAAPWQHTVYFIVLWGRHQLVVVGTKNHVWDTQPRNDTAWPVAHTAQGLCTTYLLLAMPGTTHGKWTVPRGSERRPEWKKALLNHPPTFVFSTKV